MARTLAELPKGARLTDYISLGVIAAAFPLDKVRDILRWTERTSERQRDLPAHVVIYYVIALALYMRSSYQEVLRCLLEGIRWLLGPSDTIKVTGKSGISQARTRLGAEPLRRLHDEVVAPIAQATTRGAWYRTWKVVSIDGTTLDVADTIENEKAFGRPAATVASPRSGWCRWWKTGPMCCLAPKSLDAAPAKGRWQTLRLALFGRVCCAWRTVITFPINGGPQRVSPEWPCCGGSK